MGLVTNVIKKLEGLAIVGTRTRQGRRGWDRLTRIFFPAQGKERIRKLVRSPPAKRIEKLEHP